MKPSKKILEKLQKQAEMLDREQAWATVLDTLDREMPGERKRKRTRVFWLFFLGSGLMVGAAFAATLYMGQEKE